MKHFNKLPFYLILMFICLSIFSCSGKVGNLISNSFSYTSTIDPPIMNYRLINDDSEYELISIQDNYYGAFLVDIYFGGPDDDYLLVTSIAEYALANKTAVFFVLIAENIDHIGKGAFSGWRSYQSILFQISEEEAYGDYYDFEEGWNDNCDATIYWNVDFENFTIGWNFNNGIN